jgi:aerobic C4-dicarboxylate transport protein
MERLLLVCRLAGLPLAAWEGDLDRDKARHVLDGDVLVDVTAG